jgi:hypothetical protein
MTLYPVSGEGCRELAVLGLKGVGYAVRLVKAVPQ